MRHRMTLGLAAICLLAGCNQPAVTPKPPAFQNSENTVRDWNNVADRIADQMTALGYLPAPVVQGQPVPTEPALRFAPIFIRVQAPDSAFVRGVADQLAADVLHSGAELARTPAGATVVNLDVNFVRWGPRDKPPGLVGTAAGALGVSAIVAGNSLRMATWTAADAAIPAAAGVGVLSDLALAMTPTMNAEAIWQASIVTQDRVEMMLQEPVYIRGPDIALYTKATTLSPVSSWSDAAPLATRVIRFDP